MGRRFVGAFVSAELLKLRRSRVGRAVLLASALGSPLVIGLVWLIGDDRASTFPRVTELIYLPPWLIMGFAGLLLSIEVLGSEFEQDTVRTVMSRGTPRWLFIGGKAVALLGAVALCAAVGTLTGAVFAALSHLIQSGTSGLAEGVGRFAASWSVGLVVVTSVGASFGGLAVLITTLARASAPAMLAGLLLYGGDFVVSVLGLGELDLGALSVIRSTWVLFDQTVLPGGAQMVVLSVQKSHTPGRAFFTLAFYALAGVMAASYVFNWQDLTAKS